MKTSSTQLKATARGHLSGRYSLLIIAFMIARIIINIPSMMISYTADPYSNTGYFLNFAVTFILSILSAIFVVGHNRICLRYAGSEEPVTTAEMWYGFKGHADEIIIAYFLIFIRYFVCALPFAFALVLCTMMPNAFSVLFLGAATLFTAIMCIKIELDYSQVFFLIADCVQERPKELLAHSKQLMEGNRGRLLYIQLSFIGMSLLNLLTFGFAMFWVYPYMRMTYAEFYVELKQSLFRETEGSDMQ
ncbi:MAG: DUF975 family protein [Lachnospiraceae bacterium]